MSRPLVFENCIVKNFHVPNMRAVRMCSFRARVDAISKKKTVNVTVIPKLS